ncbi:MAG: nucleotide-binding protein [Elusimicrobia bacterium]|nr:nucleotide-binding protein [Elusimicrobiota bacterium]
MPIKSNLAILRRFKGRGGVLRRAEAFRRQVLLSGEIKAAREIAMCANLQSLSPGNEIMTQGGQDNEIYFVLSGSVEVLVNGRQVGIRKADEHVGEMALIDITATRSATVKTIEQTVVARVSEKKFSRIANKYPGVWRQLAVVVAKRLRERNKFHTPPRNEPVVFIGSSSGKGLPVAQTISKYLQRCPIVVHLWTNGVFEASKTTIEDLMRTARETDFSVLVFTPDDVTRSRGVSLGAPRDNVIFETGLFMGSLGRERTYIVTPKETNLKLPTDILGLSRLTYELRRGRSMARNLQPVLRKLKALIRKFGPI